MLYDCIFSCFGLVVICAYLIYWGYVDIKYQRQFTLNRYSYYLKKRERYLNEGRDVTKIDYRLHLLKIDLDLFKEYKDIL